MKRTMLITLMAMSLALGSSWANKPTGIQPTEGHHRLTQRMQVGGEGMKATNDPARQQIPVQSNEPDNGDREKEPLLVAPGGCHSCNKNLPFSKWEQLQLFLTVLYWV